MNATARKAAPAALEAALTAAGFQGLFQRLTPDALDALWREGAGRSELARVALDPSRNALARFLAAEVLFAKVPGYPPAAARPALARVYAEALAQGFAGSANPWGLPDDGNGPLAQHALKLGAAMLPALVPLLDDAGGIPYVGSREATAGNRYAYRVKDIAAALIARIRGEPWTVNPDPAVRDRAIDALHRRLRRAPKS